MTITLNTNDVLFEKFVQNKPTGVDAFERGSGENQINYNVLINHKGGSVTLKDCDFKVGGYNCIEGCLTTDSTKAIKNLTVVGCDFEGKFANTALSFYNFADNATITIKDCTFTEVSNVLQLSNNQKAHITINIEDCVITKGDANTSDEPYRGVILLHDYTSASSEAAASNNMFGPSLITVKFKNVQYSDGTVTTNTAQLDEGTSLIHESEGENTHQLMYVYCDQGGIIGDSSRYPTVTFE